MNKTSLTNICLEMLSNEIHLQKIPGFEDIASVKLASGADGGGISLYNGDVTLSIHTKYYYNCSGKSLITSDIRGWNSCLNAPSIRNHSGYIGHHCNILYYS